MSDRCHSITSFLYHSTLYFFERMIWKSRKAAFTLLNHVKNFQPIIGKANWFIDIKELKTYLSNYPLEKKEILIQIADQVCEGKLKILGINLVGWEHESLWSKDFNTGYVWSKHYYRNMRVVPDNGSDVKIPWELSRFQFLPVIGKAFLLTNNDKYAQFAIKLIENWVESNPFLHGINWTCSMEVALRACNWFWACWFFKESKHWTPVFNRRLWIALWLHGKYIEKNLEDRGRYSNNHYLANIVGLLFLGIMCQQFPETQRWKNFGIQELIRCMQEQVYSDGVGFENSTGYQRLVLEMIGFSAILCKKNQIELPNKFWTRLEKMFEFVASSIRPDGQTPHFGDSDDGRFFIFDNFSNWGRWDHRYLMKIGATLFNRSDFKALSDQNSEEAFFLLGQEGKEIFDGLLLETYTPKSTHFPEGGICFLKNDHFYVAINAANAGVNGKGPHKHNDALHFDLSVNKDPVFLDSGTFCYSGNKLARNQFRSTSAHTTLMIDGIEQNDLYGGLWGLKKNQTKVKVNRWKSNSNFDLFDIEHDGYTRLVKPVIHRRIFLLNKKDNQLFIIDKLIGQGTHKVDMFFHFAPDISIWQTTLGNCIWEGVSGRAQISLSLSKQMKIRVIKSKYSNEYNKSVARQALQISGLCTAKSFKSILRISLDNGKQGNAGI